MNKQASIAGGVALGAAIMYFLDPNRGKQRREMVSGQLAKLSDMGRDLGNRAAETASASAGVIKNQLEECGLSKSWRGSWAPSVKALVGTAGSAVAAYAFSRAMGGRRALVPALAKRSFPPIHR